MMFEDDSFMMIIDDPWIHGIISDDSWSLTALSKVIGDIFQEIQDIHGESV